MSFLTACLGALVAVGIYGAWSGWSDRRIAVWACLVAASACLFLSIKDAEAGSPIESLRQNTVHLDVGTGFVARGRSGRYYLVTNWHVCISSEWKGQISASRESGERISGLVVKESPESDLCAAEIPPQRYGLLIGHRLYPGQAVWTRGYPQHILTESAGHVKGAITWEIAFAIQEVGVCPKHFKAERGINGRIQACSVVYHSNLSDLYSRPGSSGSPVVDESGELVGVISSLHPDQPYEAGLVPFSEVRAFLGAL